MQFISLSLSFSAYQALRNPSALTLANLTFISPVTISASAHDAATFTTSFPASRDVVAASASASQHTASLGTPLQHTSQSPQVPVTVVAPSVHPAESYSNTSLSEVLRLKKHADTLLQESRPREAIDLYTFALTLLPNLSSTDAQCNDSHEKFCSCRNAMLLNLAAAFIRCKSYDDAIMITNRAKTLDPTSPYVYYRAAEAHFYAADYTSGLEAAREGRHHCNPGSFEDTLLRNAEEKCTIYINALHFALNHVPTRFLHMPIQPRLETSGFFDPEAFILEQQPQQGTRSSVQSIRPPLGTSNDTPLSCVSLPDNEPNSRISDDALRVRNNEKRSNNHPQHNNLATLETEVAQASPRHATIDESHHSDTVCCCAPSIFTRLFL